MTTNDGSDEVMVSICNIAVLIQEYAVFIRKFKDLHTIKKVTVFKSRKGPRQIKDNTK